MQKNDIPNYTMATFGTLTGYYDSLWSSAPFDRFAATGKNKVVLVASGQTSSKDQFTSDWGQNINVNTEPVHIAFNNRLLQDVGSKYNMVFRVNELYEVKGLPGVVRYDTEARNVIVSTTAGSSIITFDSTTPVYPRDTGKCIAIPGGSSSGDLVTYGYIIYVSPTQARISAGYCPTALSSVTNSLTSVTAKIGARLMVAGSTSLNTTLHESTYAFKLIDKIGLPSPFGITNDAFYG